MSSILPTMGPHIRWATYFIQYPPQQLAHSQSSPSREANGCSAVEDIHRFLWTPHVSFQTSH
jgi:hypothetical protein